MGDEGSGYAVQLNDTKTSQEFVVEKDNQDLRSHNATVKGAIVKFAKHTQLLEHDYQNHAKREEEPKLVQKKEDEKKEEKKEEVKKSDEKKNEKKSSTIESKVKESVAKAGDKKSEKSEDKS